MVRPRRVVRIRARRDRTLLVYLVAVAGNAPRPIRYFYPRCGFRRAIFRLWTSCALYLQFGPRARLLCVRSKKWNRDLADRTAKSGNFRIDLRAGSGTDAAAFAGMRESRRSATTTGSNLNLLR